MMAESGDRRALSGVQISRHTELEFDLDDEKIEAIKSCLEKGRLSIHFSNVDLSQSVGRLGDPYLYD